MKIRHLLAALATAGALLVAGAVPAFAAGGPPVPAGCTFDQSDGVLACVTASTTTPATFSTDSIQVISPATLGAFSVTQVCDAGLPSSQVFTLIEVFNLDVIGTVTTTTTAYHHGLAGPVFKTSTSTSSAITDISSSGISCD